MGTPAVLGGITTAVEGLGAALAGMVAVVTSPVTITIALIAGIGLAIYEVWKAWDAWKLAFQRWSLPDWAKVLFGGISGALTGNPTSFAKAVLAAPSLAPKPPALKPGPARPSMVDHRYDAAFAQMARGPGAGGGTLTIDFKNPPAGMRTRTQAAPGQRIDVKRGPMMVGG